MKEKENQTTTLHLTKEEKLELENGLLKEQNLGLQIQGLQSDRQKVVSEFCKRVNQKPEDIISWDLNSGIVEFKNGKKEKSS